MQIDLLSFQKLYDFYHVEFYSSLSIQQDERIIVTFHRYSHNFC